MSRAACNVLLAVAGVVAGSAAAFAQDLTPVRVAMRPASVGQVRGTVVDRRGFPLSRVRVRIVGPAVRVGLSEGDGTFEFSSVPVGHYVVRTFATGYESVSRTIAVGPGSVSPLRLSMDRANQASADERQETESQDTAEKDAEETEGGGELLAGLGLERSSAEVDDPDDAGWEDSHEHGTTAWRLRYAKRTPLKDRTGDLERWAVPDQPEFRTVAFLDGLAPAPIGIFEQSLTGEVNLLTSSILEGPRDLLPTGLLARSVTYVTLGAEAGSVGSVKVQGAMTQGDVSSWILAGHVTGRSNRSHAYEAGMSYATQRYEGGNVAALAAVTDGARNAAELYGHDLWRITPDVVVGYGATYTHYDYLTGGGWLSPRASVSIEARDRFRVNARVARRMVAPGAEEFVPSISAGLWLPPERTFSPLIVDDGFRVERSDHYEVGVEHDLTPAMIVAFSAYTQSVADQLATLFNVGGPTGTSDLGHYFVATAGDVRTRGWSARLAHEFGHVRGEVEYSLVRAVWQQSGTTDVIAGTAGSAVRHGQDEFVDVTTSVHADIPQTDTRFFVLYRVNTAFAQAEDAGLGTRFGIQVNQALPFLNFNSAEWEMMVDVSNLFRESSPDASFYDELLVVNPPSRVVGGVLVRF